jgi:hypothetical protein
MRIIKYSGEFTHSNAVKFTRLHDKFYHNQATKMTKFYEKK